MSFSRFVQVGRVAVINYGDDEGKLCTIIDVVDHNRALVDGPRSLTGVQRQQVSFSRLSLTDFKINVSRNAREKTIKKVWEDAGISAKWEATSWAKKAAARRNRAKTGDFERFKAMLANKKRAKKITGKVRELKKATKA